MIVHDEETLGQVLQVLESQGSVRYSDTYAFVIITTPETLELQCRRALERGDIAIVVPRGHEHEMEDHTQSLTRIKAERAEEEKKAIKKWVREHPEEVEKYKKGL